MFGFADQTFKQCQQPPVQPATFFLNFFWGCKFFPSLWNFRMIVTSCPIVQHKNSNENWLWNSWNLHCYLSLRSLIYYGEKCDWNYIYIYMNAERSDKAYNKRIARHHESMREGQNCSKAGIHILGGNRRRYWTPKACDWRNLLEWCWVLPESQDDWLG